MRGIAFLLTAALAMTLAAAVPSVVVAIDDVDPPMVLLVSPAEGTTTSNNTPRILVSYLDPSGIDLSTVSMTVDGIDVSEFDTFTKNDTGIAYQVPEPLKLKNGNHTVVVTVGDMVGNIGRYKFIFVVDIETTGADEQTDPLTYVKWSAVGAGLAGVAFTAYIAYLRQTRGFRFKKHFAKFPEQKIYLIIFLPMIAGFLFILISMAYLSQTEGVSPYMFEYVVVVGVFMALVTYAVWARREKKMKSRYERAFAQFLFEMAEAMRGGLDPAKAIVELAKTASGALREHIKVASDNIRIGTPFNEVMVALARPMKSRLISRYASLIGEASSVGGETSQVLFRAAKDMDDLIRIQDERRRQLTVQVTTVYIAFGVLLIILYQLISIYPSLTSIDISFFGSTSREGGSEAATAARMTAVTLKKRFLHLMLINSFGAGLLIGQFIDGKVKYGLVHSLTMMAAATVFFMIFIL